MNQPESKHDIGNTIPTSKFYTHSPGRDVNAVDAWCFIYDKEVEDDVLEAEEIAYFADHPALLADTMAKDLMEIETNGLKSVYKNWGMWRQSPLLQTPRYYRLVTALLPSCPVDFGVFAKYRNVVDRCRFQYVDTADQFDAAREELAVFGLWLHSTNRWISLPIEDDKDASKKSRTASFEDYLAACAKLESKNVTPTRATILEVLRGDFGTTVATNTLTTYRQRMLRLCSTGSSAVRPPESAD